MGAYTKKEVWGKIIDDWGECLGAGHYWGLFWGTHIFPINPSLVFSGLAMIFTCLVFGISDTDGTPANIGIFMLYDVLCFFGFAFLFAYYDNNYLFPLKEGQ